jgi:hypothetical protein
MINELFWKTLILQNLRLRLFRNQFTISYRSTSLQMVLFDSTAAQDKCTARGLRKLALLGKKYSFSRTRLSCTVHTDST